MASYAENSIPDNLTRPLGNFFAVSLVFHCALGALLYISAHYSPHEESWGGPGGAISVGVVGSVPGIPMPRPELSTPNRVVDESKGLYKTEPPPKIPEKQPDATPIPKFDRVKPPKYVTRPSKVLENKAPPPQNAVPYGGGGTPSVPYTSFAMGTGTAPNAGMGVSNDAGGGNFGARFSWYVEAVQRRVSSNWIQATVDPGLQYAPRVVITFDVLKDGTITNVQVTKSSGNASVDTSAVRAVRDSSPLGRLPAEYSGSKVGVEFWFDYKR